MDYRKNLYPGIVLTVISSVYLAFTGQIAVFTGSGATPLDARFMPRFWGTCILILSLILVFRGIKQRKSAIASGVDLKNKVTIVQQIVNSREVVLTFVFLGIYVVAMKGIGFLITTITFLFAEILLLTPKKDRNYILTFVVAVVFACAIDLVFVRFLNVLLPAGIFGF
ncbi:MAG: tripartite tricarboxylate transporter TctB family protein [Lachnospiraceae bacterium]|nr:tripartite tricarboxylate transporter TctB family protein [Lachnospiraceae bacterium]